jgi:prepilin-type N-terminal cleavage/methylation domain-containing protein
MTTRKRSERQRGITLMEMIVVVAIFSVVFIISYSLLEDTVKTSLFLEEHNDLPIYGQSAVNAIQRELLQSRIVFEGSATSFGPGYFSVLTFPTQFPLLAGSQMPILNPTGTLIPDTNTRYTGNCLFLAKQLAPALVKGLSAGAGGSLLVDRYQFEVFYLTQRTGGHGFAGQTYYIDAIQAKSDIFADYSQLLQWSSLGTTTAADKTAVATALSNFKEPGSNLNAPMTKAWNSGVAATAAFYTINSSLGLTAINNPTIPLPTSASLVKGLTGGRVTGKMDYTVGFRPSATARFNLSTDAVASDGTVKPRDPIPKYAVFDSTQFLFPSGMEFLMVGPAGSRRILSRVVIMASYIGHLDSKESLVITSGSS